MSTTISTIIKLYIKTREINMLLVIRHRNYFYKPYGLEIFCYLLCRQKVTLKTAGFINSCY